VSGTPSLACEKRFARRIDSLPAIFLFIEDFFASRGLDRSHLAVVCLAAEEIFTNMVKYCPGAESDILTTIETRENRLAVTLTDFDVDRFDIRDLPEVRVDKPISERSPGGLGIHLVKKMVDEIEYEYADRTGRTTIIKNLG
jgi:anti-sigma regulatory factor (Ser/Thr protein kinase)